MINKTYYIIIVVVTTLFIIINSIFSVNQTQVAIVFQFGEAMRVVQEPGLSFKVPFIQNIEFFDKRVLQVDAEAKELTAVDGKRLIVDAFAKYIITDPVTFYKRVRNYQGINIRINKILESSMRKVIGTIQLTELLTNERSNIMLKIKEIVGNEAHDFGVKILDVRVLRTDLPKENSNAIYKRMQTSREKEAKQIRAEGEEEAARIRSKAEKESKILLADAYKQSQIIKGEGDSEAAKIYNLAYSNDPAFYKLYKSLSVYNEVLTNNNTSFVISPNAKFLQYLNISQFDR